MRTCVAIVPVKGRSERLPGKNFLPCAGVPLWRRAVDCAVESRVFSEVIVSSEVDFTADQVAPATFLLRPPILSMAGVPVMSVVSDMLSRRGFKDETFCVLWPTTPTRTPEVLRAMWMRFQAHASLHSVFPMRDPCLHYRHDGTAVFLRTIEFLRRLTLDLGFEDPVYPVPDSVDVNTAEDLARAEAIILAREAACPSR